MSRHVAEFQEAAAEVRRTAWKAELAIARAMSRFMPAFPVPGLRFVENAQLAAEREGFSENLVSVSDRVVIQLETLSEACRLAAHRLSEITARLESAMTDEAASPNARH